MIRHGIGRSRESRHYHSVLGLSLVIAGQACRLVAYLLGVDGTTVQRCIHVFQEARTFCVSGTDLVYGAPFDAPR